MLTVQQNSESFNFGGMSSTLNPEMLEKSIHSGFHYLIVFEKKVLEQGFQT
jgi:hypothetical protein